MTKSIHPRTKSCCHFPENSIRIPEKNKYYNFTCKTRHIIYVCFIGSLRRFLFSFIFIYFILFSFILHLKTTLINYFNSVALHVYKPDFGNASTLIFLGILNKKLKKKKKDFDLFFWFEVCFGKFTLLLYSCATPNSFSMSTVSYN